MLGQSKENGTYRIPAVSRLKLGRNLATIGELRKPDVGVGAHLSSTEEAEVGRSGV